MSGASKLVWSEQRFEREGGYSLVQNFQDVLQIPVFDFEPLVALEVCAYLLLVWSFAHPAKNREDWLLLAFLICVFGLAAGHLAKFGQTVLFVHPHWGSHSWYFIPAYLMMALIVPVRCYVAIYFIRRLVGPRWPQTANIASAGVVAAGAVFLIVNTDFNSPFRFVDGRSRSNHHEWEVTSYAGVQVMNRALPEGSVAGSWDAGVIGYFSRFPVVNLDGLVNSYDYFDDRYDPQVKIDNAYLQREFGITHLANVKRTNNTLGNELFVGALTFEHSGDERRFKVWAAGPPEDADAAARFWEKMEPHFGHRAGGVGVIADGRVAQAFSRDCGEDELVVWDWGGTRKEPAPRGWTQTQPGLCASALVLPHDALPPIRAEAMVPREYAASLVGGIQPSIRSEFDVYLIENRLVYVKEQCGPDDVDAKFFLHLEPVDADDLPEHRQQHGFDNLDFGFDRYGATFGGMCLAQVPLPEYGITAIRTGQYIRTDGGFHRPWEGEIRLDE